MRGLQPASRGRGGVDFRIALIEEQHEVVFAGQIYGAREIGRAGHRALRVGGRGEVKYRRARQHVAGDGVEVGEEAGLLRGGEEYGFRAACDSRRQIGLIKRIGDERGGASADGFARHRQENRRRKGPRVSRSAAEYGGAGAITPRNAG